MNNLVGFCIRRPVSVAMFTVAVVIFGAVSFERLALSLLPDISYPTLTVETRYPGAAPAEIEALVTRPIEEAVGVVSSVERLSSSSRAGVSEVKLEFLWKTPMDLAALDVREKLDLVELPRDAEKPVLLRFDPASDPILRLGLSGGSDLDFLRQFAQDELKKDLDSIDGVAAVKIEGGLEREIQIDLDEGRLAVYGITVHQVADALAGANVNQAGGSVYEQEARYLVRALNEFQGLEDVAATPVVDDGRRRVYMRDIAGVGWGYKERQAITRMGDRESVELSVYKEGDANTVQVARLLKRRLETVRKGLPAGVEATVLFDQSTFIEQAVAEVVSNAWQGGLLAIAVIFLFLRDPRATGIIGLSIPVSVVATFFIMYQMGLSLNIMSLGGLALGIGMLVDDSIVVLESIYRHRALGKPARQAAVDGTSEVGAAVIASTLTTVAVFLPIVFVEGVAGQLFKDQALTVSISILASLAFSLTLIPVLAAHLGGPAEIPSVEGPPLSPGWRGRFLYGAPVWVFGRLRRVGGAARSGLSRLMAPPLEHFDRMEGAVYRAYPKFLGAALSHRALVLAAAAGLFVASLLTARGLGVELIPNLAQGEYYFEVELPEGTPIEVTDRVLSEAGAEIKTIPGVRSYFTSAGATGGSSGAEATGRGEHRGRIHVVMKDRADRETEERAIQHIRERLARYAGLTSKFGRPTLFSFQTPVELAIYGDRPQELAAAAERIAKRLRAIRGLTDVETTAEPGNPELQIFFDRDRMARMGITLDEASRTLRAKLRGEVATRLKEGERQIDIVVRAAAESRARAEQVPELTVQGPGKEAISLKTVGLTELATGPAEIRRIGQRRAVVVSGNLQGRDLGSVTRDIGEAVVALGLPSSVSVQLAGQNLEMASSFQSLYLAIFLAVFLVYFVMASEFESLLHPFIILFTIPLGLVGVIWALLVVRQTVSVIVLIGVVMLAGIVVKNAIVMVDYINTLRGRGVPKRDAILEAGKIRLRPILMTTLTTVLGLLPMALGLGEGAEIRQPMAITVIGGLSISTLLTLVVIPTVYSVLDRKRFAGETG